MRQEPEVLGFAGTVAFHPLRLKSRHRAGNSRVQTLIQAPKLSGGNSYPLREGELSNRLANCAIPVHYMRERVAQLLQLDPIGARAQRDLRFVWTTCGHGDRGLIRRICRPDQAVVVDFRVRRVWR